MSAPDRPEASKLATADVQIIPELMLGLHFSCIFSTVLGRGRMIEFGPDSLTSIYASDALCTTLK